MNCPKCGADVPAADINLQALVGVCRACNELFRLLDQLPPAEAPAVAAPAVRYPRPSTIIVVEDGESRAMQYRWFKPMFFFLLFFCIAWDSFLIFWYVMAIGGFGGGNGPGLLFIIFPIAHVAIGVGLTYFVICGFFNRTVIGVTGGMFFVRHRPIPFPGNRTIPADALKEVYLEMSTTTTSGRNARVTQNYLVAGVTDDGQRHKLISGLELAECRFVVQQINDWLGLKPSPLGVQG